MNSPQRIISAVVGLVCGVVSTHLLDIGWENLIFWAIVGIMIGFFVTGKHNILWCGGLYGFFMSMSFLLSGFQGASEKILIFTLFSLALSVIGVGGGMVSVFIGSWVRAHFA